MLVCTDESPDSQGMVAAALGLAQATGSKVFLLQVVPLIPGYGLYAQDWLPPSLAPVDLELLALREDAVLEHLETWKARAQEAGVDLEIRVRTNPAADSGILEEAEGVQPDLIIIGRHGLSGLSRLLMGSVTARVIGHSPFKVLVVPRGADLEFTSILVANDGSPFSDAAWEEALDLGLRQRARLIAVSVAQVEKDLDKAGEIVGQMEAAARERGVTVEPLVLKGRPYEAIVQSAQEHKANLIVLGSHGRTGLARLLMGSVAERVIGLAPCPVLVVKKS